MSNSPWIPIATPKMQPCKLQSHCNTKLCKSKLNLTIKMLIVERTYDFFYLIVNNVTFKLLFDYWLL